MSEIVKQLHALADECDDYEGDLPLGVAVACLEAADVIERLEREVQQSVERWEGQLLLNAKLVDQRDRLRQEAGRLTVLADDLQLRLDNANCGNDAALAEAEAEIERLRAANESLEVTLAECMRERDELRQALHAMNFMKRCNMVVDGGSFMLNVDSPFFDSLVFAEPVGSGTWLNTIKHLKSQRDDCRFLLRDVLSRIEPWEGLQLYPVELQRKWVEAARKAAGGE